MHTSLFIFAFATVCMHTYILPSSLLCTGLALCPVKGEQGRGSEAATGQFYASTSSPNILQPRCVSCFRQLTALLQVFLCLDGQWP